MLANELSRLEQLVACDAGCQLKEECNRIKIAWSAAVFSTAADQELRRYFSYHLKGVSELATRAGSAEQQLALAGLAEHMAACYPAFFDTSVATAPCHSRMVLVSLLPRRNDLMARLDQLALPKALDSMLLSYMEEVNRTARHTFSSLGYYRLFLSKLDVTGLSAGLLHQCLLEIGFNHLGYFSWLQQSFVAEGGYRQLLARYAGQPQPLRDIYDPGWPPVQEMICGWLQEAIKLSESAAPTTPIPKLPLALPVSHLAFLTRLFQEEGIFGSTPLAAIFKFLSASYTTKRQSTISTGSLSKEFYSTDQQAAARVRGLLQNMIARINRNYFPETVVISAVIAFLAGNC